MNFNFITNSWRYLSKILYFIIALYIIALVYLYNVQREIIYEPDTAKLILAESYKKYFTEVSIDTKDGLKLISWYAKSVDNKPTILYFHGSHGSIIDRIDNLIPFVKYGFGLLMLSYRGYGGNQGEISEEGFYKDARAGIKFLLDKNIELPNIILFGESLGTGIAIQMAIEYPAKLLILQSPYTSMVDLAYIKYPMFPNKWFVKDVFDSFSKTQQINQRTIVIHGLKDQTVPYYMGEKIHTNINNSRLFSDVKAGHGDILTNDMAQKIIKEISQNMKYEDK